MKVPRWRAPDGLATTSTSDGSSAHSSFAGQCFVGLRFVWIFAFCALLSAGGSRPSHASDPRPQIPLQVRRPLEMEDWPAVLKGLAGNPFTNTISRLVLVRSLFEAGRLPEEQFSWLHRPGPELLSTTDLEQHAGSAHVAETLLELGHLNAAERLAFDSLEMEGETPSVLRTLARLHAVKGLPDAAGIFLNRLQVYPGHGAWAGRFRATLSTNAPDAADPILSRIRANLITRDALGAGLTTERLLREALESNRENRMAFQFLMAHQLIERRLLQAQRTLSTSPQVRQGPLPRHYAEAVLLHRRVYPGISLDALVARVPPAVATNFQGFDHLTSRAKGSLEEVRAAAWRDFGNTYWYYYFFGHMHPPSPLADPGGETEEDRGWTETGIADMASPPQVGETPPASEALRLPRVAPDYRDVVIPPNLAPLNLSIREPGSEYHLRLSGSGGQPIELRQPHPHIRFPLGAWKDLVGANRGGALRWDIAVRGPSGEWIAYAPFETRVAEEEIDGSILYRRLRPLFSYYRHLGIYERNLGTFEEKPVLRNATFEHGCVNCHTFLGGAPDRFALDFRARSGTPTLLIEGNRVSRIDTKMGYLAWHPSGKLLVFSANTISQFFHIAGPSNRDISDPRSDLGVFHASDQSVEKPVPIALPDRSENWPCWAPDGRRLYYSSAPTVAFRDERNFRYDLLSIPYDPDQDSWGEPETLFSGAEHSLSAHQPRVSPDGRYLVFTVSDSGSFPVFRSNSDLFLMRLDTRELEPLPINSNQADT